MGPHSSTRKDIEGILVAIGLVNHVDINPDCIP